MGRTTIDGLAVRDSGDSKRKVPHASKAVRSSGVEGVSRAAGARRSAVRKSMDMKSSRGSSRQRATAITNAPENASAPVQKRSRRSSRRVTTDSFLEPVRSFDYEAASSELDAAFGPLALGPGSSLSDGNAASDADWSDLLGELSSEGATSELSDFRSQSSAEEFAKPINSGRWLDDWAERPSDEFSANRPLADDESSQDDEQQELLDKFVEEDERPRKKKRKKRFSFGKALALTVLLVLVLGGGALYVWGDGLISRLTGGKSGLFDSLLAIVSDEVPFETDKNGRTNVLIFGTEGYDMNGTSGNGTHDGAQLTDSIMVASFDQKTKDVALLSLPRDLKVSMACSAGKINEVFWCHNQDGTNEEAGAQALMTQIGKILGIEFQYYAHVNWASLIEIIDTLGGITVTLDEDINDYYYTGAVAKAGEPITVNGEQALGLARARHGTTGGDFTRGNTQQKIVEGIAQKVLQNGVGVNEALGLLNILGDNLRSNFSADNIKAAVRLASGFNISNIRQVPLVNYDENIFYVTTATINEVSYVVPAAGERNYSEIQKYVAGMFSSDGVKREGAQLAVYNATGLSGIAAAERGKLEADDFDVVRVGDADSETCSEMYCVYETDDSKVATRAALEERYGVSVQPASEIPDGVWAGDADFVIIIGAVSDDSDE